MSPPPALRPAHPPASRPHIVGFDYLRLSAMACVTVQHGLSVIGCYEWTQIAPGCTLGQFGVAVFCGLAGRFALDDRQVPGARPEARPGDWIIARLIRLYPAYWAATLFAFALALMLGRPITAGLFVSQMLGLGYFTHGMALVNVVSWFISLILLCYALAAAARLTPRPRLCMAAFALAALMPAASGVETVLARHVLTFAAAAALAEAGAGAGRPWLTLAVGAALIIVAVTVAPALLVSGTALILIRLFEMRIWPSAAFVETTAAYVYEYFLLHGLFLQAGVKFVGPSTTGLAVGLIACIPAVVILKRFADAMAVRLRFMAGRRRPAPELAGKPPPG
jgi:peptidoglycan/LPS O-acetylase OafA/YrhL